jgi:hypothetical protein
LWKTHTYSWQVSLSLFALSITIISRRVLSTLGSFHSLYVLRLHCGLCSSP